MNIKYPLMGELILDALSRNRYRVNDAKDSSIINDIDIVIPRTKSSAKIVISKSYYYSDDFEIKYMKQMDIRIHKNFWTSIRLDETNLFDVEHYKLLDDIFEKIRLDLQNGVTQYHRNNDRELKTIFEKLIG